MQVYIPIFRIDWGLSDFKESLITVMCLESICQDGSPSYLGYLDGQCDLNGLDNREFVERPRYILGDCGILPLSKDN